MASCAYCNSSILLGGKRNGALRFCNSECESKGALASLAQQLPSEEVDKYVRLTHQGPCPKCQGPGPVDVHRSYRVWSAIFMTSWSNRPAICCKACGTKTKLLDTLYCAVLGWWGIPWGLLMTPVQVIRNLVSIATPPNPTTPSAELERLLRLEWAARIAQSQQAG